MTTINDKVSSRATKEVVSTVERMMLLAREEIGAFNRGEKTGNYGITQLSKDVAARTGETFGFAYAVCSSYVEKVGLVSKPGRNGGFPRPKSAEAPPPPKASAPVVEPEPEPEIVIPDPPRTEPAIEAAAE